MPSIAEDILEYCRVHSMKMEDLGWHKTSMVLEVAADEIERLRKVVQVLAKQVKLKGENHEDQ